MRKIHLIVLFLGVFTASSSAWSAACCISATGNGVGRLRIWEEWAFGSSQSTSIGLSRWDKAGSIKFYGVPYAENNGFTEAEFRSQFWGLFRLSERAQIYGKVPLIFTHRVIPTQQSLGGGFGDLSAGLRYEVIEVGEYLELPALALSIGFIGPSGRTIEQSALALATDATGRGAWLLTAGASIEKTFFPFFVQFNLGMSMAAPSYNLRTQQEQWLGAGLNGNLTVGWEVFPDLFVLNFLTRINWNSPLAKGEKLTPDSDSMKTGVGAGFSWIFHPHYTFIFSASSDALMPYFGKNQFGNVQANIGVRYGYF